MFEISTHVPVPPRGDNKFTQTLFLLEPGESFFVPDTPIGPISARVTYFSKKTGRKFTCRRMMGGVRVWRTV